MGLEPPDTRYPMSTPRTWAAHMHEARSLSPDQLAHYATSPDPGHRLTFCVCFGCACRVVVRERLAASSQP